MGRRTSRGILAVLAGAAVLAAPIPIGAQRANAAPVTSPAGLRSALLSEQRIHALSGTSGATQSEHLTSGRVGFWSPGDDVGAKAGCVRALRDTRLDLPVEGRYRAESVVGPGVQIVRSPTSADGRSALAAIRAALTACRGEELATRRIGLLRSVSRSSFDVEMTAPYGNRTTPHVWAVRGAGDVIVFAIAEHPAVADRLAAAQRARVLHP